MNNHEYNTLTMGATLSCCTNNNTVVDKTLQKKMLNAETDEQVLALSINRLYQSLKDSIELCNNQV